MYIMASTYGGIDWSDSSTVGRQVKYNGSYNIGEDDIAKAVAEDISTEFPYVEDVQKQVEQALLEEGGFFFMIKEKHEDCGSVSYLECDSYEDDAGEVHAVNEAFFDGGEMALYLNYEKGQVTFTRRYFIDDIPNERIGYIVTEDFYAPARGVALMQRLYHDIFDKLEDAEKYAGELKAHEFTSPKSDIRLFVCDKEKVASEAWYQGQKEVMRLMEEKRQSYLDDSFHVLTEIHKENLERLP